MPKRCTDMALTELDAQRAYAAQLLMRQHRGWLVLWSPWRRTFTAFSCFTPMPLVMDAPTAAGLSAELSRVEAYYQSNPPSPSPVFSSPWTAATAADR